MAISLFFTELLPIFLYKHLNFCIFLTIGFSQNLFCLFRHFYTFAHKPLLYDVCCDSFFPCAYLTEPRNITKMPYDPGIFPGHTASKFIFQLLIFFTESRMIICVGRTTSVSASSGFPSSIFTSISTATWPFSWISWRTVVSAGRTS